VEDQKPKKKTRIKLVGDGWNNFQDKLFYIYKGSFIDVVLDDSLREFTDCNGNTWVASDDYYAIEILPDEPEALPPEMVNVTEKPFEFRVGDKIKVPWSDKVFTLSEHPNPIYPLIVEGIDDRSTYKIFTIHGKLNPNHDKPILTLVKRPKKTVKKTYWVATYSNQLSNTTLVMRLLNNKEELVQTLSHLKDVQLHEITRDELCD
jgi:hypothetical protein